jgi:hypothetical protein
MTERHNLPDADELLKLSDAELVMRYNVRRSELHRAQALAFYRRVALENRIIAAGHQAKADALRKS